MQTAYRTHTCGALRAEHTGQTVTLAGWVDRRRDYGKLLFIDLRDRFGKLQVVCAQEETAVLATLRTLRHEDVVRVKGTVSLREEAQRNPKLATGDIELRALEIEVLNRSRTPPFDVNAPEQEGDEVASETRLRYRPLDLRRPAMQKRLAVRHQITRSLRRFFDDEGFVDVETPILTRATPEGARDYLVPSRVTQGSFYALPQSPQLFKQLLMIGGFDRYYQIARCFRDEDLRADRQPEFTQLDLEMSFVDEEDIYRVLERCLQHVWADVLGRDLAAPFPRISYDDAMLRYGIDKPDLRFGLEIHDVSAIARRTEAAFLRDPASEPAGPGKRGGAARAICAPQAAKKLTRRLLDHLPEVVRPAGAKGVAWLKVAEDGALKGSVRRFFEGELGAELRTALGAGPGDVILIVADGNADIAAQAAGLLRLHLGRTLELIDQTKDRPCWITDFPYFEHDPQTETYIACRHPFTQPSLEDATQLEEDPRKVHARAYDLVLNGVELGSGSIRNHDVELQRRVLAVLGYDEAESERRFGFLLESLQFGAPPHGGAALGLDRFAALIQGLANLREVVAFPKTARATCLLTGAPSTVEPDQLEALAIAVTTPAEDAAD